MKTKNYGLYAIALAIIVVGALAFGVPAGSLGVFAFVLICPLMMFFMMRGMSGMGGGQDKNDMHHDHEDQIHHDDPLHRS